MYVLEPYFNSMKVVPADLLYKLPNYHREFLSENGIEAIANEQTDSIKLLENRQLQLIEDLKQLVENVTEMLLSTQKNKKTKQIVENTDQQQEIVKFIKGVTPFCYIQKKDEISGVRQTLSANERPSYAMFETSTPFNLISINISRRELNWLRHIMELGAKRSISFKCDGLRAENIEARYNIQVTLLDNEDSQPEANIDGNIITGRIGVWKILGVLLGIYPSFNQSPIISTHIDGWLLTINAIFNGHINEDKVYRLMNNILGCNDYLASTYSATLADLVAHSIAENLVSCANNLELWMKRLNEAIR